MNRASKRSNAAETIFALDELSGGNTFLHQAHPAPKLFLTLFYLCVVLSVGKYRLTDTFLLAVFPILILAASGIEARTLLKRLAVAMPFVAFAALSNIIFERTSALMIGNLPVSYGVLAALTLIVKYILCVCGVLILIASTPAEQLFAQLRHWHIPKVIVTTLMLCIRYLTLIISEAEQMALAYKLRSPDSRGIDMRHMGSFIAQLLLRSMNRAEQVYQAMLLRGYDGDYPVSEKRSIQNSEILWSILLCGLMLAARIFNIENIINSFIRMGL